MNVVRGFFASFSPQRSSTPETDVEQRQRRGGGRPSLTRRLPVREESLEDGVERSTTPSPSQPRGQDIPSISTRTNARRNVRVQTDDLGGRVQRDPSEVEHLRKELTAELALPSTKVAIADSTSIADAARKLGELNEEIFHLAAMLADSDVYPRAEAPAPNAFFHQYGQYLFRLVGAEVAQYFVTTPPCAVPDVLVQFILQAAMVEWCHWVICSWGCGAESEQLLSALLESLRVREGAGDAARWRAATRKHAELVVVEQLEGRKNDLLSRVAIVVQLMNQGMAPEAIYAVAGERAGAICDAAMDLKHAIGAEIVSDDLETWRDPPRTAFVPGRMESVGADVSHAGGFVLLTTALGLGCGRRVASRGAERDGENVLVKPKVLLSTDWKELLE
ncbi:hypothetical protein MKEN_01113600 [Mycena kentingensis (nom. inval.)]|nr:hypothetical protein MKEN_01113600 [Mycena kentingensis (nom. inval.)]